MARTSNPAATVIRYFETADLPVAETVLGIVRALVAKRRPTKKKATVKSIVHPGGTPVTPPVANALVKAAPRTRKLKDVPLPGMPGPVATVGD